jgi:hypothetical protein
MEPYFDIGQGVFDSILRLQETTGRMLLDNDGNLLIPSRVGGEVWIGSWLPSPAARS